MHRALQPRLLLALVTLTFALSSTGSEAQVRYVQSAFCAGLLKDIGILRTGVVSSRKTLVTALKAVGTLKPAQADLAQVNATLVSALYTSDTAHLDALVRLYTGACTAPGK